MDSTPPPPTPQYERFCARFLIPIDIQLETLDSPGQLTATLHYSISYSGSHPTVTPRYIGSIISPLLAFPLPLADIDSKQKEQRELPLPAVKSNQYLSVPCTVGDKFEKLSNAK